MSAAQDIIVTIPAGTDHVHIVRTVVAGVAARLDFPYDSIEDLKLAVSEACAHLLEMADPDASLTASIRPTDGGVDVTVASDTPVTWPPDGLEGTLTWQVLKALTRDPGFAPTDDGRPSISFSLIPAR